MDGDTEAASGRSGGGGSGRGGIEAFPGKRPDAGLRARLRAGARGRYRRDPSSRLELVRLEPETDRTVLASGSGRSATVLHCGSGGGLGSLERAGERRPLVFVPGTVLVDAGRLDGLYRLPPMRAHLLAVPRPEGSRAWLPPSLEAFDRHCGLCDVEGGVAALLGRLWRDCDPSAGRHGTGSTLLDVTLERLAWRVTIAGERARRVSGLARLDDFRLMRAVWYVEANLDDTLDVAALAAVARLSVYRFAHLFAAAAGEPPHRYVMRRRLERSIESLGPDGPPLSEVALRYGFSSQAHFTRRFGEALGLTPGEWRRRMTSVGAPQIDRGPR